MASVPKSPFAVRSKPPKKYQIRLGNDNGDPPTDQDISKRLKNPRIVQGNGGLDYIEMEYDLGGEGERLIDFQIKAGFIRQVEIWQEATNKGDPPKCMAFGEIVSQRMEVKSGPGGGERIIVTAAVMKYHFGNPMAGASYRRPTGGHDAVTHHEQIVFNPVVDELVENNRSLYTDTATNKFKHWVHPESVRTAAARQYGQDSESASAWDLPNVINTLLWLLNPDEDYIKNPSGTDVDTWLADAPEVRDLKIPSGKYLNEYLDLILAPYGYGWRLEHSDNGSLFFSGRNISIVLFSLSSGQVVELYKQRPGDAQGAKFTLSNVTDFDIDTEIVSLANKVKLFGGFKEREITVELFRGWPEADDVLTADGLKKSNPLGVYESHQSAWRLWVGNEDGGYCNTRTVVAPIGSTPLDLTGVLGANTLPRRRKAEDCLTLYIDDVSHGARRRRPPFIQYRDADAVWHPIPDGWGEVVLKDQIGICFDGDTVPEELVALGNDARIRMTFTVVGDEQMTSTANHNADSPNGRTNELQLDVSDRFKDRSVQTTGTYASILAGAPSVDSRNDQTEMDAFAEKLRSTEDCAIIRGQVKLIGIHPQYKIGQFVKRIRGRNISLNRLATTASTKRYLQITGKEYDYESQTTSLTMEPTQEAPGKLEL